MQIRINNLRLSARSIDKLPGYELMLRTGWEKLGMGFFQLGHWSCKNGVWTDPVEEKVKLEAILHTDTPTPLGGRNVGRYNARMKRLLGAAQMSGPDMLKALRAQFPYQTVTVPKAQIEFLASETRSIVAGFWRMDRHVLLIPPHWRKTGDFYILALPEQIRFAAYVTEYCDGRVPSERDGNILWDATHGFGLDGPMVYMSYDMPIRRKILPAKGSKHPDINRDVPKPTYGLDAGLDDPEKTMLRWRMGKTIERDTLKHLRQSLKGK